LPQLRAEIRAANEKVHFVLMTTAANIDKTTPMVSIALR
jgi:hypothetical protein